MDANQVLNDLSDAAEKFKQVTAAPAKQKTQAELTADRIEALEERRKKRRGATAEARAEQYAKDLEAIDGIEVGGETVALLDVAFFTPGLPTVVGVKPPSEQFFTRFRQQVRKAGNNLEARGAAMDQLATVCVVYPEIDTYKLMLKTYPGMHDTVAMKAVALGEGKTIEEGKG